MYATFYSNSQGRQLGKERAHLQGGPQLELLNRQHTGRCFLELKGFHTHCLASSETGCPDPAAGELKGSLGCVWPKSPSPGPGKPPDKGSAPFHLAAPQLWDKNAPKGLSESILQGAFNSLGKPHRLGAAQPLSFSTKLKGTRSPSPVPTGNNPPGN